MCLTNNLFSLILLFAPTLQQICDLDFEIISNLSPKSCNNEDKYYTEENCFPVCKEFPTSGKQNCNDTTPCISGYVCVNNICASDKNSCAIYHANTNDNKNEYYSAVFKPDCANDGSWLAKQCKGEATTGRCFCYDSVGNRIFGQAWRTEADDMTCACSRKKADLLSGTNARWYVSLHCDTMGNFEALQCDSGLCWCVDKKTGDLTSPVVPEKVMTKLDCCKCSSTRYSAICEDPITLLPYQNDPITVGAQYLRQCESEKYAQAKITNVFNIHGTVYVNFPTLICDDDGSYGAYKISNGIAYCTWRDNSNIGTWQSESTTDLTSLTCNCAKDSKIFENAGLTQTQSCVGNGNYKVFQQAGASTYYCVDEDGYQNSTITPQVDTDCIRSY